MSPHTLFYSSLNSKMRKYKKDENEIEANIKIQKIKNDIKKNELNERYDLASKLAEISRLKNIIINGGKDLGPISNQDFGPDNGPETYPMKKPIKRALTKKVIEPKHFINLNPDQAANTERENANRRLDEAFIKWEKRNITKKKANEIGREAAFSGKNRALAREAAKEASSFVNRQKNIAGIINEQKIYDLINNNKLGIPQKGEIDKVYNTTGKYTPPPLRKTSIESNAPTESTTITGIDNREFNIGDFTPYLNNVDKLRQFIKDNKLPIPLTGDAKLAKKARDGREYAYVGIDQLRANVRKVFNP